MSETPENLCLRYQRLKGEREGNWDVYVQECADFVLPRHNQIVQIQTPGTRRRLNIYDSTAIIANERLAAGLFSYLTPPNRRWFEFQSKDEELRENEDVKRWFGEMTEITYQEIAKSNFSLEMHELYLTLGFAGTACIYLEEGEANALNFENIHYSQFVFERGEDGIADTVFREFQLTARKAVDRWGANLLSEKINEASNDPKRQDNNFTFLHAVLPRRDRDASKKDSENMPFASHYLEFDEKRLITEGGYDENPFAVPRFIKDPKEKQGRSPAMSVLETIKLVNAMMLTILKVTQKQADPPMLVPSINDMQNLNTAPGKMIVYKPNQFNAKPEPLITGGDLNVALEILDRERAVIKSAFYEDLFSMLITNQDKDKTATEVRELVDERETIFAPTWGRLQAELFNVVLTRCVGILMRKGMFPDVPDILLPDNQGPGTTNEEPGTLAFDIEYVGKLAIKVKSTELLAFFNTIELMTPLAEARPEILDWFKFDDIPAFTAERFGVPVKFIREKEEVDKLREARAQAAKQQQQQEMALEAMKSADKISGPVDSASIIAQMAGNGGIG